MPKVEKKPAQSNSVTPYFTLKGADKAIEFYKHVFGATEDFRMDGPDGKVVHAALRIGDSQIMLTEERPEWTKGKKGMGPTQSSTYVYVDDPDAALKRAKEKGAEVVMEPADMFYGDRTACFIDPCGQVWTVALHIEDVSDAEVRRRGQEMFGKAA
ncbi:MAG: VOC family protein [Alphaproteobacteria bacterium PRO2]|nr:VOC family protein [Alphaproteobacteria bacterium PRO2]